MRRRRARVLDVARAAAAAADAGRGAARVVEPQGDADDVVARVDQHGGGRRGVDAARHGDHDPLARPARHDGVISVAPPPDPRDDLADQRRRAVDLFQRRPAAEAEAERAGRLLPGQPERQQHRRGIQRSRGASGAGRDRHPFEIEAGRHQLSGRPGEADVERPRQCARPIAVASRVGNRKQPRLETLPQRGDPRAL